MLEAGCTCGTRAFSCFPPTHPGRFRRYQPGNCAPCRTGGGGGAARSGLPAPRPRRLGGLRRHLDRLRGHGKGHQPDRRAIWRRWSDLGGWDAVWREERTRCAGRRDLGTCHRDRLHRYACCAPRMGSGPLVGIGLTDVIAVAMPDAVLVAHKDRAQDVKQAGTALKGAGRAAGRNPAARLPPLGLVREPCHGRALSGQAHPCPSRRGAVLAKPPPPVRTLDRRRGHGQGDGGRP